MSQYRKKEWNKKIWIAKKIGTQENDYGTEIPIYDKPQEYMMNVQPLSSEADIAEFGENSKQVQRAVIKLKEYFDKFKEFDVAYLDGVSPLDNGGEYVIDVSELDKANIKLINQLKVKNLATGKLEYYTCDNANYRLYPPRNQNKVILLYFERLTAK